MPVYQFSYPQEISSGHVFVQASSCEEAQEILDHYATMNFMEDAISAKFVGEISKELAEQMIVNEGDEYQVFALRRDDQAEDGRWVFHKNFA